MLGAVLFLVLLVELVRLPQVSALPFVGQVVVWALAVAALAAAYLLVSRVIDLMEQRRALEQRLDEFQGQTNAAFDQLENIFKVSQRFVLAQEEDEIIQPVLQLLSELCGAQGAAFVPLDEHGQPQTVVSHGILPIPVMDAWLHYLATPGVRHRCRSCEAREPLVRPTDCPLLQGPFADVPGLVCFSVRRGEREFGVINVFLPEHKPLDARQHLFVQTLLDETALGLESVYLRKRELMALRQMQMLRRQADLSGLLESLLSSVCQTLDADFSLLIAPRSAGLVNRIDLACGDLPAAVRPFLDGLLQGVITSAEPVLLSDLAGDPASGPGGRPALKSVVAAPLLAPEGGTLGAVLVGNVRSRVFQPRQLALLQTFAGQAALIVQNAELMAELEYKTMIQERARLAREIHDGLAQTIGFLKLQGAQMRGYLQRGEFERAQTTFEQFYAVLSEAYQDARQAIDGLRVSPDEDGLPGWLEQIAREFQDLTGIVVDVDTRELNGSLRPEVQAQLIRIVQEALSNVRKHAQARQVWIGCCQFEDDLLLEVRDDGIGFAPQDVTAPSRYGLRSMRERAELIGADFQVVSRPQDGAVVRVRLPVVRNEMS